MTDPDARPAWFETRGSETTYDGMLSRVRVDEVAMPDGSVSDREVVEHPDAVAVVPLTDDGSVILLKQYRHPHGRYLLEIPAGKLDHEDEEPEEAARRELVEEVGLDATDLQPLVTFHNSAGWTTESTTIYLASGLREARPDEDFVPKAEEADMEVVRLAFDDAVLMASRGELPDAKTIIGLVLAAERRRR